MAQRIMERVANILDRYEMAESSQEWTAYEAELAEALDLLEEVSR